MRSGGGGGHGIVGVDSGFVADFVGKIAVVVAKFMGFFFFFFFVLL